MEDLKQREDEERRSRLVFSVIVYQTAFYLRIFNIGKENAFNGKIKAVPVRDCTQFYLPAEL